MCKTLFKKDKFSTGKTLKKTFDSHMGHLKIQKIALILKNRFNSYTV